MSTPSLDAATAAYLACRGPVLSAMAERATTAGEARAALAVGTALTTALLIGASGLLPKLRRRWSSIPAGPVQDALGVVLFMLAFEVLRAPWRVADALGRGGTIWAALTSSEQETVAASLLLFGLLQVSLWFPKRGWLVLGGIGAAWLMAWFLIVPLTLSPMLRLDRPAQSSPAVEVVQRLVDPTGAHPVPVHLYASPDPLAVDLEGVGRRGYVALGQAALASGPSDEVLATIGHQLGHVRRWDIVKLALLQGVLLIGGLWLGQGLARRLAERRRPVRGVDALPWLAAFGIAGLAIAHPITSALDRTINVAADQASLEIAQRPDGLIRSLIAVEGLSRPDPGFLEEWLFYDHPPLKSRILHALSWKIAHPGLDQDAVRKGWSICPTMSSGASGAP